MLKISKFIVFIVAVFFAGCSMNQKATTSSSQTAYSKTKPASKTAVSSTNKMQENFKKTSVNDVCKNGDIMACMNYADLMYAKGDFNSAINAYDINCARQDIASCVKLAKMFEKGEGTAKNLNFALDIHTRACYSGYKPSCSDMKRLQKSI